MDYWMAHLFIIRKNVKKTFMKILNLTKACFLILLFSFCQFSYAEIPSVSDTALVSTIKEKFSEDKMLSDLNINIASKEGVVTLSGKVNTDAEADKLIQIAETTPGVTDVITSELTAKESKRAMSDTTITAKVKAKYLSEKVFGDKDISLLGVNVETTNGIVYLSGMVDTQEEADNAVKFAKEIRNVKKVESKLEIKQSS